MITLEETYTHNQTCVTGDSMPDKRLSYTSACGAFPLKIVVNKELLNSIIDRKTIIPIHVQLCPTNRCNLKCEWCSCSEVDRNIEMDYCTIIDVMTRYKRLGCQTVTITGGGEPLLHKRINDVIGRLYDMGISMGMVTNGWNITRLSSENINKLTWVRISLGDSRKRELTTPTYWKKLHDVVDKGTRVDWSFSYVLTKQPYYKLIEKMLEFANLHKFTHIRMTSDIFIADQLSESMNLVRQWVKRNGIDDRIVIYQDRAGWDRGQKQCLISLLKPVVSADGNIYPCCGVQYALDPPTKDFATRLRMGTIRDIERIINEQKFFDGSVCVKCYYKHYNDLLSFLLSDVEHTGFV